MEEALSNGYYPQLALYYLQSLRLFNLTGLVTYEDGKSISEEILMDYSGDFDNNSELFEEYRAFIAASPTIGAEQKERQLRGIWQRQLKLRTQDLELVWKGYDAWETKGNLKGNFKKIWEENKRTWGVYREVWGEVIGIDDLVDEGGKLEENLGRAKAVLARVKEGRGEGGKLSVMFCQSVYEKVCGWYPRKMELWGEYLEFLDSQTNSSRVLNVYRRLARNFRSFELSLKIIKSADFYSTVS